MPSGGDTVGLGGTTAFVEFQSQSQGVEIWIGAQSHDSTPLRVAFLRPRDQKAEGAAIWIRGAFSGTSSRRFGWGGIFRRYRAGADPNDESS